MTDRLRFAVIGDPISHSRSPAMHMAAFGALGLPHSYVARRVKKGDLKLALRSLAAEGFRGVNLTVPLKRAALECLDECDEFAARAGAVNTVTFGNGRALGTNTDGMGFLRALAELGSDPILDVVLLGAGGAARGIADALLRGTPRPRLRWVSRDPDAIPDWMGVERLHYGEVLRCRGADLLINATTVGMTGSATSWPVEPPLQGLSPGARVVDIVVSRPVGGLLDRAESLGFRVQDGRRMLLWQGVRSAEIWLDTTLPGQAIQAMSDVLHVG